MFQYRSTAWMDDRTILAGYRRARNLRQYDVSRDGVRFLMIRERRASANHGVVYGENWLSELRAKVQR